MHTTDRRAALFAVLLSALAVFALGACGSPDKSSAAAAPTAALAATATTVSTRTATESAAPAAGASDTSSATATAAPSATTATDAVTATPLPTTAPVDGTDPFTGTDELDDTDNISVTVQITNTGALIVTQPVAIAIAEHFGVPVAEVITLHADGLGFGEIARAYFLARELAADGDQTNDLTVVQILALHQSGLGWGRIVVKLNLPHGNSERNLGLIMSGPKQHDGGTVVVVVPATQDDDRGPHASPPGHQRDRKDKDKPHGNGHSGGGKKGK